MLSLLIIQYMNYIQKSMAYVCQHQKLQFKIWTKILTKPEIEHKQNIIKDCKIMK